MSSFLVGELAESFGFDGQGFGDQLLRVSVGGLTNTVLNNATNIALGQTGVKLFSGIDSFGGIATNIAGSISGFVGGYLAHQIVSPTSVAGSIGGSLGGAIGGAIAAPGGVLIGAVSSALGITAGTIASTVLRGILPGVDCEIPVSVGLMPTCPEAGFAKAPGLWWEREGRVKDTPAALALAFFAANDNVEVAGATVVSYAA